MCPSIYLSISSYLPTYLPIYLSIHPSIYLSIYLSKISKISKISIGLKESIPVSWFTVKAFPSKTWFLNMCCAPMCPRHGYHIFIGADDLVTKLEQARKIGKSPQANGFYHQFLQKKKTIFLHLPRHNFHPEVLRWTRPKNWKNPCSRSCDNLWTTWNGPEPCNTSGVEVSVLSWGHPQLSSKKKNDNGLVLKAFWWLGDPRYDLRNLHISMLNSSIFCNCTR